MTATEAIGEGDRSDQRVTSAEAPPVPLSRNRDFQLLWWGRAIGGVGNALSFLAFPLVAQLHLGGSHAAGLTLLADQLGELGTLLVAGVIADRVDRRRLLLVATGLQLLAVGTVFALLARGVLTLSVLMACVFVAGSAWSLYGTAETAAVAQVVPGSQRAAAAGRNQARGFVVGLVAAPMGGVLFALDDRLPFALDVVLGLVLIAALLAIRHRLVIDRGTDRMPRGVVAQAREGFGFLLRDRLQRRILVVLAVINAVSPVLVLAVVAIAARANHGGTGTGLVYGVGIALGLAGSLTVPRLMRTGRPGLLVAAALALMTACLAGMAVATRSLPVAGACYALTFLVVPVLSSVLVGYRVARTPQRLQGRSQAAAALLVLALRPLVSVAAGYALGQSIGAAVAVSAGVFAVLTASVALSPSIRRMPPATQWAAEV